MINKFCFYLFFLFSLAYVFALPELTFNGAISHCTSKNVYMQPNGEITMTEIEGLKKAMVAGDMESIWIPIKKTDFSKWKWLDPNIAISSIRDSSKPDKRCARANDEWNLDARSCYTKRAVMCQYNTPLELCKAIDPGAKHHWNVTDSVCLAVHEDVTLDWHTAAAFCDKKQGQLAALNTSMLTEVKKFAVKDLGGIYVTFWLGLRKEEWQWTDPRNGSKRPKYVYWRSETLKQTGRGCAVMLSDGTWKTADCSEKHHFLCTKRNEPTSSVAPTEEPAKDALKTVSRISETSLVGKAAGEYETTKGDIVTTKPTNTEGEVLEYGLRWKAPQLYLMILGGVGAVNIVTMAVLCFLIRRVRTLKEKLPRHSGIVSYAENAAYDDVAPFPATYDSAGYMTPRPSLTADRPFYGALRAKVAPQV